MRATLVTPPAEEPVALEEAKAHLRVLHDSEDDLIDALIPAAREWAEGYTRRAFLTQTWALRLDAFPSGKVYLPRAPLQSVTSVAYTDGNGAAQAVAGVQAVLDPARPFVAPAYGAEWPIARDTFDAVTITYVAGYGDRAWEVPQAIRQAILLQVGTMYQHREGIITGTIVAQNPVALRLLSQYRLPAVP